MNLNEWIYELKINGEVYRPASLHKALEKKEVLVNDMGELFKGNERLCEFYIFWDRKYFVKIREQTFFNELVIPSILNVTYFITDCDFRNGLTILD